MLKSLIITTGLLVAGAANAGKSPESKNDISIENMLCIYDSDFDFTRCTAEEGRSAETMVELEYHQGTNTTKLYLPTSRMKKVKSSGDEWDVIYNSSNRNGELEIPLDICFSNAKKGVGVQECLNTDDYGLSVFVQYHRVVSSDGYLQETKFRPVLSWQGRPGQNKFLIDLVHQLSDNPDSKGLVSYFATDYFVDTNRRTPDFGGEKWNQKDWSDFEEIYNATK